MKLGHDEADRGGRPGFGGDHAVRRGPRPVSDRHERTSAEILVVGVSVDGGHEALLNTYRFMQWLGDRGEAVGGA